MSNDDLMPFDLPKKEKKPKQRIIIKVIGVGGGGGNAVNNMYEQGIENVDFVIANTDSQVLADSPVDKQIQLGYSLTEGLGAGNDPERGKNAATESKEDVIELLSDGTKMVFITAGMGGGTGTGAAPIIAEAAKELGILTIGIVTIPFLFEGDKRIIQAIEGINELKKHVDSLIVINNEKISEVYSKYTIIEAFKFADQVLTIAAKGIAEIITKPGEVNVDFADVNSVMKDSGVAVMGTGYGKGDDRAITAVKKAISSPLLNNNDIKGAKNLLVNIITPTDKQISTEELKKINQFLQNEAGNNANLIWGVTMDDNLKNSETAVTVIATEFNDDIVPDINDIISKDKEIEQTNQEQNQTQQEQQEKPENDDDENRKELDIEQVAEKINNMKNTKFDFTNNEIVDKIEDEPAYLRQNLKIFNRKPDYKKDKDDNNQNNDSERPNDFLNPMFD